MPMDLLKVEAAFGIVEEWPLEMSGGDASRVLLLANSAFFPVFTERSAQTHAALINNNKLFKDIRHNSLFPDIKRYSCCPELYDKICLKIAAA
jgi:hypothetical protein